MARTRAVTVLSMEFERKESKTILNTWKVGIAIPEQGETANGAGFEGRSEFQF